jgi:hypothetical protein
LESLDVDRLADGVRCLFLVSIAFVFVFVAIDFFLHRLTDSAEPQWDASTCILPEVCTKGYYIISPNVGKAKMDQFIKLRLVL